MPKQDVYCHIHGSMLVDDCPTCSEQRIAVYGEPEAPAEDVVSKSVQRRVAAMQHAAETPTEEPEPEAPAEELEAPEPAPEAPAKKPAARKRKK